MYNQEYISSITTTAVASNKCLLHSIVIGETAAGAITVKDGDTTVAVLKSGIAEGVYDFDIVIREGLNVVTAAASKITVTWRPVN